MELIDELNFGENKYTKLKYGPLDAANFASRYILYTSTRNSDELERLYLSALKKVSVNGELLDNEIKLNNHFSKFPEQLRAVRLWALQEGFQSFLDSSFPTPELEEKYYNI
jgi:hypothetical protein